MEDKSKNHQSETSGEQQVDVFFPDEVKKGVYANNVFINHTPEEIVLDFLNVIPPAGSVVSRVVLNPSHAKRLVRALQENLEKYEKTYGEVPFEIKPINE